MQSKKNQCWSPDSKLVTDFHFDVYGAALIRIAAAHKQESVSLHHQNMSGINTDYYVRIGVYSLQMSYHMILWPTTNFLALLDLVLAHIYILWKLKLIHDETSEMQTCGIYIYYLLKKCIFYTIWRRSANAD